MTWLRSITTEYQEYSSITRLLDIIEQNIDVNPEVCVDCSKAMIETCCKTILMDRGITAGKDESTPKLAKLTFETTITSQFVEEDTKESLKKIGSGYGQMIYGISELRNKSGLVSHGHDGATPRLHPSVAKLSVNLTDPICAFLIQMHKNFSDVRKYHRIFYADYKEFNEYFDEQTSPVQIGIYTIAPSEVLYAVDIQAYKEELLAWTEANQKEPVEPNESDDEENGS